MRQVQIADVPGGDIDAEGVVTSALAVRDASERLRSAGDQVVGIWSGLPRCYDAPEAPTLHAAMDPVAHDTTTYAEAAGAAASALTRYSEDVAAVQARMQVTAPLVHALAGRVAQSPVWRSDTSITNQNSTLHRQVRDAEEDLETAASVCAAAIRRALSGGSRGPVPYLTAPGPLGTDPLRRHLASLDDPRSNPFFFVGKTPADVNAWWRGLSPGAQRQLVTGRPDLVGNRDGIPAAARDEANRLRLATARAEVEKEIRELEKRLAGDPRFSPHNPDYTGPQLPIGPLLWDEAGKMLLRRAQARLETIAVLERTISRTEVAPRQLLTLRLTSGYPRAAVAVGDVDSARHVGVLVGGTGMTVVGGLEKTDTDAQALLRVGRQLARNSSESLAIVSWLDYHAPPTLTNAVAPNRSLVGGRDLARFAEGISSSTTSTSGTQVSIFGHSYGALVANEAGSRAPKAISSLIVGGAPGVGNQQAEGVERYSLLSHNDPIRGFHALGGETSLGLIPYDFASEANHGPWTVLSTKGHTTPEGHQTIGSSGHSEYLTDLSTSQRNIAAVLSGQIDAITR